MRSARRPAAGAVRRSRGSLAARAQAKGIVGFFAVCAALAGPHAGCGTRAVGVEDCRDLEYARCEAAAQCGDITDVDACRRFYRNHCAHGLPLSEAPAGTEVEACKLAIVAAGACAERAGVTADTTSCADPDLSAGSDPRVAKVCDVVRHPEFVPACSFLVEPPDETDASIIDAPSEGSPDAGYPDAGDPDAGDPDAGSLDAGDPDVGSGEPGSPDAGG